MIYEIPRLPVVKFTARNGKPILIAINSIVAIKPPNPNTHIRGSEIVTTNGSFFVKETTEKIAKFTDFS
jgi:hypothetical protein